MKIKGWIIFWAFIIGWGVIGFEISQQLSGWQKNLFILVMLLLFFLIIFNKNIQDWFERFKD